MRYQFETKEIKTCMGCPCCGYDSDSDDYFCFLMLGKGEYEIINFDKIPNNCPLEKIED